ncbi:MAG TPA: sugar isomerase [Armatimonadota bacterium]|jgi:L-rhamnose isomerase/sugar isomerase
MDWHTAIEASNHKAQAHHNTDWEALAERIARTGRDPEAIVARVAAFGVAVPSWGVSTGGTRFGRFPGEGEPRNLSEKLEDAASLHALTGAAPRVSLHIPWDTTNDPAAVRQQAAELGIGFDAVNSNTFEDQPGQPLSYKFGSLCHTDPAVREQAIAHNIEVIKVGQSLGSKALSVWIGDGGSYPGQMSLRKSFDRTLDSFRAIYAALPADWKLWSEHKPFEPAFYSTVVSDWGTSYLIATALGPQASCLVDLGHHVPNTNIEQVVARLISAGKLGGFHFNDSKYADDDLTTGSIKPYQLFLVFNELVDAEAEKVPGFDPGYMIDQSHNLKDPLEDLLQSIVNIQSSFAKALLIDRAALNGYQDANDVVMAENTLKDAFETDVRALCAEARLRSGGAIEPIAAFRASGYRALKARERPQKRATAGAFG